MIHLQILSKSYKTAYEYRYKIGTSLESKEIMRNIIWQGRRVNLFKKCDLPRLF